MSNFGNALSDKAPLINPSFNGIVTIPTINITKTFNNLLTATSGRAAVDNGANTEPRYIPAKWCFSTDEDPENGDMYTIQIPYAGGTGGVYMSVNGDTATKYYPVIISGTTKFTTQYTAGETLTVIFESAASAGSMYDLEPADNTTSTKTGGAFRVLNYRDSNTNTLLRTYASATNINVPLIGQSSAAKTTAAWSTYTGTYKDWYGVIPNDDTKRAKINLSTGMLTVPGGITGNLTGTASKATADASGNTISTTYAKLVSPALTGIPTAPTAAAGTNTTQIATTAFVQQEKFSGGTLTKDLILSTNVAGGTPKLIFKDDYESNTSWGLKVNDDKLVFGIQGTTSFAPKIEFSTGKKILSSDTSYYNSIITVGDSSQQGVLQLYSYNSGGKTVSLVPVQDITASRKLRLPNKDGVIATLESPSFTGTPTAPTAAAGTNTTQIATTAFVKAAIDAAIGGIENGSY